MMKRPQYLYLQIQIENCNWTANPLIKGIHHPDTGQALLNTLTKGLTGQQHQCITEPTHVIYLPRHIPNTNTLHQYLFQHNLI